MVYQYITWHLLYSLTVLLLFLSTYIFSLPDFFVHIPLVLASVPIAFEAYKKLKNKKISTEFFLVIATVIALIGHQEQAITVVLLIMLFAEYLEHLIEQRTESAINSLVKLIPTDVLVTSNSEQKYIPLEKVQPGMTIIVNTGGRIPVDGSIVEGTASINESPLTGESTLLDKTVSESVYAGTFVEAGSIVIKAQKVGENTFFSKIRALIEQAETHKAHISRLADRIALFLVPSILLFITLVWVITGNTRLVVTLLVFGSPLELTLITPLAVLSGVIAAFKQGILVKGGIALERLAYVDTMIFDKTGTLTLGDPHVIRIDVLNEHYTERDIIKIAAIAEKRSGHPLGKALHRKAVQEHIEVPDPQEYISITGHGVSITYKGKKYFLGSKHFIEAPEHGNIKIDQKLLCSSQQEPFTSFYLASQDSVCGRICVADSVRYESNKTIQALKKDNLDILLLSGDKQIVVDHIASLLHIKKAYGNLLPDQKLDIIKKLEKKGHKVAMVGDGINDAPALKQAFVGIAMGGMGMEPAIEAADVVLMTNDLYKIVFVRNLSKKVLRVIKQNIFIGFALIHAIGITLAFLGILNPVQAALFHAIPDVLILANSVRLINYTGS